MQTVCMILDLDLMEAASQSKFLKKNTENCTVFFMQLMHVAWHHSLIVNFRSCYRTNYMLECKVMVWNEY